MGQTLSHPKVELVRDTLVEFSHDDHHYLLLWPKVASHSSLLLQHALTFY
jgi:hypothetical protein